MNCIKLKMLILKKLKDQDLNLKKKKLTQIHNEQSVTSKIVASVIIALSGLILYADKAFMYLNITFTPPSKFENAIDSETYIWLLTQSVSPLLIILGAYLRPYHIAYTIPIYCYCLQLYFVLLDTKTVDNTYLQAYVIGSTLLIMLCFYGIKLLIALLVRRKLLRAKEKIKTLLHDV